MEAPALSGHVATMRRALILFAETTLRPIIRVLLRYGLSYPELNQIARKLYADIAMHETEFLIPRRNQQHKSRVACITGLSRKEILRLLESERPADNPRLQSFNRAARVLEGWLSDPRYTDANGEPLPLPFRAADGHRSFSELVGSYSGDIPPRAVLEELRRSATCITWNDAEIRVCRGYYLAQPVDVETITAAAMRAAAALGKIDAALTPPTAPATERSAATPAHYALL